MSKATDVFDKAEFDKIQGQNRVMASYMMRANLYSKPKRDDILPTVNTIGLYVRQLSQKNAKK